MSRIVLITLSSDRGGTRRRGGRFAPLEDDVFGRIERNFPLAEQAERTVLSNPLEKRSKTLIITRGMDV